MADSELWNINLWTDCNNVCKLDRDLLKELKRKDKKAFLSLFEQMTQYTAQPIDALKRLGDLERVSTEKGMWELKFHLSKNEIRFLGCIVLEKGKEVYYALHAFKKKEQKIKRKNIETAKERIKEFTIEKQYGFQELF